MDSADRLCVVCRAPAIEPDVHPDVVNCRECELERQEGEGAFLPNGTDRDRVVAFIGGSSWRLAETMLDIPHQYTVRDLSSPDARRTTALGHRAFEWFAEFIRSEGVEKPWGPYRNTYLTVDGWEYWTMGHPIPETTIINRQPAGREAEAILSGLVELALERRSDSATGT